MNYDDLSPLEREIKRYKKITLLDVICSVIWLLAGILNLLGKTNSFICIIDFALAILWAIIASLNLKQYNICKKEFMKFDEVNNKRDN